MNNVPIARATLGRLADVLSDIAFQAEQPLDPMPDAWDGFLEELSSLDAGGADQACEAFMAEREELQAALTFANFERDEVKRMLRQELDSARVYTQALRDQIEVLTTREEGANAAFHRISQYANSLQANLGQLGIQHQAGEDGEPVILLSIARLAEVVDQYAMASAG